MTIVAKVGNNEIYTPVEFKSKGIIKKTMVPHQNFTDLNKTIDYCKRHNEVYEGLVDLFEFEINDKIIKLITKATYEEIFTWETSKKIFGKEVAGSFQLRKFLKTMALNTIIYRNPEGSEYKFTIGNPNPEIFAKVTYDSVLYDLHQAYGYLLEGKKKVFKKFLETALSIYNIDKDTVDLTDFDQIIEYFESKK